MLKEAQNYVVVEGILSEIDIEDKSFVKDGSKKEALGGSIKVKVNQVIEGEARDLEIPVHMFSTRYTNKGGENPAYLSIQRVMNDFKSIAAAGIDEADRVRITGAKIGMNEYFASDGADRLISFPRIQASFVTKIKPEDCKMRATWELDAFIGKMGYKLDKEGIETETFEIKAIVIGYAERADIVPIITNDPKIAGAIFATYQEGETVPMSGRLNFTSTTETFMEEVEIGEPIEKTKTVNVSEIIITGVKNAKEEGAYEMSEIQDALQARSARLEAVKAKAAVAQPGETKAPAQAAGRVDLGF